MTRMSSATNYTESGYDPNDGLVAGEWVPGPGGVQRWVGETPEATKPRTMACSDFGTGIGKNATRCRPCNLMRVRLTNRRYMRYAREQEVA